MHGSYYFDLERKDRPWINNLTLEVEKCGPLSTFLKLRQLWSHKTADWTGPQELLSVLSVFVALSPFKGRWSHGRF